MRCGDSTHNAFQGTSLPEVWRSQPMTVTQGGVKLVVEDYPYAKHGLELSDAIKEWVSKYVHHVHNSSDEAVRSDPGIQAWWNVIVNVGHADKKDAPWWPKVDSIESLVDIISTTAWISGPHHAAVNFGQYAYGAFMPNAPQLFANTSRRKANLSTKWPWPDPRNSFCPYYRPKPKPLSS